MKTGGFFLFAKNVAILPKTELYGYIIEIVYLTCRSMSKNETYCIGMMLSLEGYDATLAEQTPRTLSGILNLSTLLPAAGTVLMLVFMAKYPIGRKEYDLLLQANADKKAGKPVDERGFENCL